MTNLSLVAPVPTAGRRTSRARGAAWHLDASNLHSHGMAACYGAARCPAAPQRPNSLAGATRRSAAPRHRPVPWSGNAAPQLGQHYCPM